MTEATTAAGAAMRTVVLSDWPPSSGPGARLPVCELGFGEEETVGFEGTNWVGSGGAAARAGSGLDVGATVELVEALPDGVAEDVAVTDDDDDVSVEVVVVGGGGDEDSFFSHAIPLSQASFEPGCSSLFHHFAAGEEVEADG
ncbi:hypothetical protein HK104_009196 [Borealophlyctis nickersoniae]|nr:hypothetical protein HK104_009196 [Borealophlyctis nickersoniae]